MRPEIAKLCSPCKRKEGYVLKDNVAHTGRMTKCVECGLTKPIMHIRHYTYEGRENA